MANKSRIEEKATEISWAIFIVCFILSLFEIAYEGIVWLKTGARLNLHFSSLFTWLHIDLTNIIQGIEWQGIKKIVIWILARPLSLMIFILGAVFGAMFKELFANKKV